jgi:hypothetical protein
MALSHDFKDLQGRTALGVGSDGYVTFGFPQNKMGFTADGGLYVWFSNKTGAPSVLGMLVTPGSETGSVVAVTGGIPNSVGAIADSGVADGGHVRVVIAGVARVLFADGQAPTVGYWCGSSGTVDGRAEARATVPDNSGAGIDIHNREIGHILETKASGTDVTAKVLLHFN